MRWWEESKNGSLRLMDGGFKKAYDAKYTALGYPGMSCAGKMVMHYNNL